MIEIKDTKETTTLKDKFDNFLKTKAVLNSTVERLK